ncbi:MAG: uracil-DNA glycosylase [Saprospiraceae bacterium]
MQYHTLIKNKLWASILEQEMNKPYFIEIFNKLDHFENDDKTIYPERSKIFNAFISCPIDKIKVVIIGQDPYHKEGQAMGLSFSVPKNIKIPPSLKRIFREVNNDIGCSIPDHGDLSYWASQGVFLLNSILTVEEGQPGAHAKIGWEVFTDAVINILSNEKSNLCFLLWGNYAKSKKTLIDSNKHHVFESVHPSPLAGNGFFNNHHFSKINSVLKLKGKEEIDWQIQ